VKRGDLFWIGKRYGMTEKIFMIDNKKNDWEGSNTHTSPEGALPPSLIHMKSASHEKEFGRGGVVLFANIVKMATQRREGKGTSQY